MFGVSGFFLSRNHTRVFRSVYFKCIIFVFVFIFVSDTGLIAVNFVYCISFLLLFFQRYAISSDLDGLVPRKQINKGHFTSAVGAVLCVSCSSQMKWSVFGVFFQRYACFSDSNGLVPQRQIINGHFTSAVLCISCSLCTS